MKTNYENVVFYGDVNLKNSFVALNFIETRKDILQGVAYFRISETATLSWALLGLVCC